MSYIRFVLCTILVSGLHAVTESTEAQAASLRESIPFVNGPVARDLDSIVTPLDWLAVPSARASDDIVTIRYKMLNPTSKKLPLLFFVGGGPGVASMGASGYFYSPQEILGRVGYPAHYRVVMFDQRGVGQSDMVDPDSPRLNPEMVLRYFASPSHVRDLGALIRRLAKDEPFYLMGHSFGGRIVERYLADSYANPKVGPRPNGIILANSLPTLARGEGVAAAILNAQIALNIARMTPELAVKLTQVRQKIEGLKYSLVDGTTLAPEHLDFFYERLGHLADVARLKDTVDSMLKPAFSGTDFESSMGRRIDAAMSPFRRVLVAAEQLAPLSEREFSLVTREIMSTESRPWMLLEARALERVREDRVLVSSDVRNADWSAVLLERAIKTSYKIVSTEELRAGAKDVPVLAIQGDTDPLIPMKVALAGLNAMRTNPKEQVLKIVPGGHETGLLPVMAAWTRKQFARAGTCSDFSQK